MLMTFEVPEDIGLAATEAESEETKLEAFETKTDHGETQSAGEETEDTSAETDDGLGELEGTIIDGDGETGCPVGQQEQQHTLISDGIGEWQLTCKRIEHEISDLVIERVGLQERNKSIRKRIDCLAEELAELRAKGPQAVWRTPEQPPSPPASCCSESVASVTVTAAPLQIDGITQSATDNAWRAAPVGELEKHGLKPSVLEKLTEAGIETIGKLEDRRADISQGREKWPKGIGAAKITQIEDAVIAWLTDNRDRGVFAMTAETTAATETTAAATANPPASEPLPTSDEWEKMSDKQVKDWISDRVDLLKTTNTADKESDTYDSGRQAFNAGVPLFDCPYIPSEEMDLWLLGWKSAYDQYASSEANQDMGEPRDTPQASEPAISIDDL